MQAIGRTIEQGEVTGEAKLTPIQQWFFEQEWEENHHFNQAMMLYRREGFEIAILQQVLEKLTKHHDALRMVFRQTEEGYL
ncbi:condensation domain-containing protein, partial [Caldalkalibacillus mannanilyticus]|uniref:condensation domain-containing protein n=1 Tax=Caldalkalibacillus mannanilyticus TaxID=1418 RepID=UPI0011DD667D